MSEVKLGLIPATIAPCVIETMGERATQRYFVIAGHFSMQESRRAGYVHQAVALDDMESGVQAAAVEGITTVRLAKRLSM